MTTEANKKSEFKPPIIFEITKYCKSWDEWQGQTEGLLKKIGYNRYEQGYKQEDFAYWKTFHNNQTAIYQVGLLFYDFRKFGNNFFGFSYECHIIEVDAGVRLEISDSITLQQFEKIAQTFYESMSHYYTNKNEK